MGSGLLAHLDSFLSDIANRLNKRRKELKYVHHTHSLYTPLPNDCTIYVHRAIRDQQAMVDKIIATKKLEEAQRVLDEQRIIANAALTTIIQAVHNKAVNKTMSTMCYLSF